MANKVSNSGSKMVLVPYKKYNLMNSRIKELEAQQNGDSKNSSTVTEEKLLDLDDEIQSVLDNKSLSDFEKINLYTEKMNEFIEMKKKLTDKSGASLPKTVISNDDSTSVPSGGEHSKTVDNSDHHGEHSKTVDANDNSTHSKSVEIKDSTNTPSGGESSTLTTTGGTTKRNDNEGGSSPAKKRSSGSGSGGSTSKKASYDHILANWIPF